jgi:hypothetical protein
MCRRSGCVEMWSRSKRCNKSLSVVMPCTAEGSTDQQPYGHARSFFISGLIRSTMTVYFGFGTQSNFFSISYIDSCSGTFWLAPRYPARVTRGRRPTPNPHALPLASLSPRRRYSRSQHNPVGHDAEEIFFRARRLFASLHDGEVGWLTACTDTRPALGGWWLPPRRLP